jgi:serine protease Do
MNLSRTWSAARASLVALCLIMSASAHAELPEFTSLVEANSPAVVNISTTQKVQAATGPQLPPGMEMPELPEGSPFSDLFKHFFDEGEDGMPEEYDAQSLGSGFIISGDGYILTNYHVTKGADEIIVRLSDRRELIAELIGADERSDIALLKIDAKELPTAKLGDSENVKVGEWVLAIGSPFGFDHSVTAGIVSAIGRSLPSENYVPFIQTDVAINPGNSGGPLFNMRGEVVGINSQIFSRTGGYMGLSFAIPIEVAMEVVEQLKVKGKVSRGWLGVHIQDVTRELAESFGLKKPMGALVAKVLPDSPAGDAGVQVGDIIIEFNSHEIDRSAGLPPLVGRARVGSSLPMKVLRDGKRLSLSVTLGELPEDEVTKLAGETPKSKVNNSLGLSVTDLTAEQRKQMEIDDYGVLVQEVAGGPAYGAGVRKGDVLLSIDGEQIKDSAHFDEVIKKLPAGKTVPILVSRRSGPRFLALKVPEGK